MDYSIELFEQGKIVADGALRSLAHHSTEKKEKGRSKEPPPCMHEALAKLHTLIGLEKPKQHIKECVAYAEMQRIRMERGLKADNISLHMSFTGNPGTGKTSLARVLGEIYNQLQILPKGHLVEVDRGDLVGEYIGHTAQKTKKALQKAMGGILFIDEAYSLNRGDDRDFGMEAIDTLVKEIEDHRDEIILIVAGYPLEMDGFFDTNPGLKSRIPTHIHFPDYTLDELMDITKTMLLERDYFLAAHGEEQLKLILKKEIQSGNRGNGRTVRNVLEQAYRKQSSRLLLQKRSLGLKEMMELKGVDFREGEILCPV